jgi:hypothetical protein
VSRQLFERADSDGSGHVSREELLAVIRNKEPQLMTFLKKVGLITIPYTN